MNPLAYANQILEFNGSEQITSSEIAEKIAGIIKEPTRYISPEVDGFENKLNKIGLPNYITKILSTFILATARGEFDPKSIDLQTVLGRKTKSLTEFLTKNYN